MTEKQHNWQVGDLCKCTYGGTGHGVIYRVINVLRVGDESRYWQLNIVPAHAVIASTKRRGKRRIGAGWCTHITLIDLASEYQKFGLFISEEAKKRGEDGAA